MGLIPRLNNPLPRRLWPGRRKIMRNTSCVHWLTARSKTVLAILMSANDLVRAKKSSHVEAIRHRPKNSTGQSEKSGSGEERKEELRQCIHLRWPAELTPMKKAALSQSLPTRTTADRNGADQDSRSPRISFWMAIPRSN